jgi:S1-C subfamily serine protease
MRAGGSEVVVIRQPIRPPVAREGVFIGELTSSRQTEPLARPGAVASRNWTAQGPRGWRGRSCLAAHALLQTGVHLGHTLLLSLIGLGPVVAQEMKPEEIYQQLLPSVVTLQVENQAGERYVGTGFLALSNTVAVTAWHVVADARKVTARFADNEFVDVLGVVDRDEKNDLALIRLAGCSRPQVTLNIGNAPVGSRAYVIGAPKGYEFSVADGLISQIRKVDGVNQYQVSCPISGGNSGGPLVNGCGEVIGVTSWSKADAQNVNFAIPSSCLASLDPSLPLKPWGEWVKSGAIGMKTEDGAKPVSTADHGVSLNGLPALKQALKGAAGEEVTVILVRDGRTETFSFVAPVEPLAEPPSEKAAGGVATTTEPAVDDQLLWEE